MSSTSPSSHSPKQLRVWATLTTLAIAFALAAMTYPFFAERWRVDSPTRFSGTDNFITQRAQTAFLEAVKRPDLTRQERRELILEGYRAALADAPFAPFTWREAAAAHYDAGFDEEGARFLAVARRMDPTNPALRYEIANEILFREGPAEAFEDYRVALDLDFLAARLAYQHYWRFGYDPLALLEELIPPREAPRRRYLFDSLTGLAPAKADLVLGELLPELKSAYREDMQKSVERKTRGRVPPHLRESGPREPVEVYEGPDARRTISLVLAQSFAILRRRPNTLNFQTVAARRALLFESLYDLKNDTDHWLQAASAASTDSTSISAPLRADLAGLGLFNPAWKLPLAQLGPGDWLLPSTEDHIYCGPGTDPSFLKGDDRLEEKEGWLRIEFDDFGGASVTSPAQTLLLDGRTSYSLTFSWATRGLFTDRPLYLEVATRQRAPLKRARPKRFRSEPMMGERGPNREKISFYLVDENPEPLSIRVTRSTAAEYEPRLRGELWLRFEALKRSPLPLEFIPREVDTETLLRTYNIPEPDLFGDWELLEE